MIDHTYVLKAAREINKALPFPNIRNTITKIKTQESQMKKGR